METDQTPQWSPNDNPRDVSIQFLARFRYLWFTSRVGNFLKVQIDDFDHNDTGDLFVQVISLLNDLKLLIETTRNYALTKVDTDKEGAKELLTLTHQLGDWVDRAKFFGEMIMDKSYQFSRERKIDFRKSLESNLKRIDALMESQT